MSTVTTQQVEETEQQLIDMAAAAIRQSNWKIGEAASKWTTRYASGRTDADFATLVGSSQPVVNTARRVYERFYSRGINDRYKWKEWRVIVAWQDAKEALDWAEGTGAEFREMSAWRNAKNGLPLTPEPVKAPTQTAPEPHEPIVQPITDEPVPSGEVQQSARMPAAPAGNSENDSAAPERSDLSPPVEPSRPHVTNNSGEVEWYTPADIIDVAREVMGDIDLDPASCETANDVVNAAEFFDKEQNGLEQEWHGRVFMNPPYAAGLVGEFTDKLLSHVRTETVSEAVVLVNNATETKWFQSLAQASDAICFPRSRIRFWNPHRNESMTGLQGQAVVYFGPNTGRFRTVLSKQGVTVTR